MTAADTLCDDFLPEGTPEQASPPAPSLEFSASPRREAGRVGPPLLTASAVISLALHVAVAAILLFARPKQDLGAIEERTEAISVEVVLSDVIEQSNESAVSDAAAASQAAAAAPGGVPEMATVEEHKDVVTEMVEPAPPLERVAEPPVEPLKDASEHASADTVISSPVSDVAAEAIARTTDPQPDPKSDAKREPEPHPRSEVKKPAPKTERKSSRSVAEGGALSRATAGSASSSGRVSASTGDVLAYAARVRARVAGNRPSGRGISGRAVVAFGVTSGGGLAYITLRQSSGNAAADQAALAAVRRSSPFPAPPPGTPSSRLTFSVPFVFR